MISIIQDLDQFKSHPPFPTNDQWGEDYRDGAQIVRIPINPSQVSKTTRSGKTVQEPKRWRKLVTNPSDDDEIVPAAYSRNVAQQEEDRC